MARGKPVLIVENSTGIGGSTISLLRLVGRLRNGEYEPHVLFYRANGYLRRFTELMVDTAVMKADGQPVRHGVRSPESVNRTGVRFPGGSSRRLICQEMPEALRIRRLIKQKGVCLVHINGRLDGCRGAILASRMAGVPCVCHVRDFNAFGSLDRAFARLVTLFIYISKAVRSHTEQGIPGARGRLVYDGVDQAEFSSSFDPARERDVWGLDEGDLVIGNIGRLVEWKGQHVFLQAVSEIAGSVPNLKAVVAGEPDPPEDVSYARSLRDLTERLGLQDRVVFTGFVENVPRLLSAFDVLAHSSVRPEPFGLTILEGMAAGLPVVASAAGGALDLVQDGVTGRLVPSSDPRAMGSALLQTVARPDECRSMGLAAREYVAANFSIEQFADGIRNVYAIALS